MSRYEWSIRHVKWLRANGCPWDEATTEYAKTEEFYLWATQNGCPKENGCLVGKIALFMNGNFDTLKW